MNKMKPINTKGVNCLELTNNDRSKKKKDNNRDRFSLPNFEFEVLPHLCTDSSQPFVPILRAH